MRALFWGVIVAAGVTVALVAVHCSRDANDASTSQPSRGGDRAALSQPPPRHAQAWERQDPTSSLAVHMQVPYPVLASTLEQRFPASLPISGSQPLCLDERVADAVPRLLPGNGVLGRLLRAVQVCGAIDYEATIRRDRGAVMVSHAERGIHVGIPVSVEGRFGVAGDLAGLPGLGPRSFRGAVIAYADVDLDLDADWCPKLEVHPGFEWIDRAQLEVREQVWINIDAQVDRALDTAMRQATASIGDWLDCEQAREVVAPYWEARTVAGTLPDGTAAHVTIEPEGAGFSGLGYAPAGVGMSWQVDAIVRAATGAPPADARQARPLPELRRIPKSTNTLRVAVPVSLGYDDLSATLTRALSAQPFTGDTRLGPVTVTVSAVSVYPSGDRLVFGVDFDARAARAGVLDASGTVYLLGEPVLDVATQTLSVRRVAFSRVLDNRLWNLLSALFQGRIASAIEGAAVFPLAPRIDAGRRVAGPALEIAAREAGVDLTLRDDFVGLDRVVLSEQAIEIEARLEGTADVTLLAQP